MKRYSAHPSLAFASLALASLALAFFGLAASAQAAQQGTALACTGPFARNATPESIARAFGAANVTSEEINAGEGEKEKITVLFAGDPAQRLEIFWQDNEGKRSIAQIRVGAGSAWRTPQGLSVGMALADVEKINGKPFLLSGFGWEMGGTTRGWQDGKLQTQPGGCFLMLRFKPTKATKANIEGDRDIPSGNAGMRSAAPVVELIAPHYPD